MVEVQVATGGRDEWAPPLEQAVRAVLSRMEVAEGEVAHGPHQEQ